MSLPDTMTFLEDALLSNNLLDDPHRIYNCDETGLPLNPKPLKVVDAVDTRNPSYITGDTKRQITVLACTNAAGFTMPPMVIFDRKSLNPQNNGQRGNSGDHLWFVL